MRAGAAAAALLLLAACHPDAPGVTLDADEDARNATGAKIAADLAAADQAARVPLPRTAAPPAEVRPATDAPEPADPDDGRSTADGNAD